MSALLAWAIEALVASALLMALVLALRTPVRRAFGAHVAYALWALPALRLALPPLPHEWHGDAAMPVSGMGEAAITVLTVTTVTSATASVGSAVPSASGVLLLAWLVGAAAVLAWQVARYIVFRAQVLQGAVTTGRVGRVTVVESAGASGPLAFGVIRRTVALPCDAAARWDAAERDLALAHELGHHARGDLLANWVALVVLALHWWNPLAWVAFRAFRADQEMANDAGVIARAGAAARHAYGCAIVKAAHGRAIAAACHLHSVRDLKGRLKMLSQAPGSSRRLTAGMVAAVGVTLAGLFATASGGAAAERVRDTVEATTGVDLAALEAVRAFRPDDASATASGAETTHNVRRVVVTRDGKTDTYEGAAADAYLAANPLPVTPVPPVPPVPDVADVPSVPPAPPIPPMPSTGSTGTQVYTVRTDRDATRWNGTVPHAPAVVSRTCRNGPDGGENETVHHSGRGGTAVTVICTNRIERMAERASRSAVDADDISRRAIASALASLRASRDGIAANHDMGEEARSEALEEMDEAIHELEQEARAGA